MKKNLPVISVITVVYNGEELLEGTIRSVIGQSYSPVEYIIVDGQSKDGTVALIEKWEAEVDRWISEPDRGIYDAMNKGLRLATGDFVIFMNCGDHFHKRDTLEKMVQQYHPEADVLYGETMMVDEQRQPLGLCSEITTQKVPERLSWKSFKLGQVVTHQAFMLRRELAEPYLLDNLCADIDWMIKGLKKARHTLNTRVIVADFLVGGTSRLQHQQSLVDRYRVLQQHFGFLPNLYHHVIIIGRAIWFKITNFGKRTY